MSITALQCSSDASNTGRGRRTCPRPVRQRVRTGARLHSGETREQALQRCRARTIVVSRGSVSVETATAGSRRARAHGAPAGRRDSVSRDTLARTRPGRPAASCRHEAKRGRVAARRRRHWPGRRRSWASRHSDRRQLAVD